jgi:hypothetical protein
MEQTAVSETGPAALLENTTPNKTSIDCDFDRQS